MSSAPSRQLLFHEEQGVEHDRFCEGDGQNRLDHNLRGRAGITSHRIRSPHADQTHAYRRAQRGQTNVEVSDSLPLPIWY